MSARIRSQVAAAREAARGAGGRFGKQPRTDPGQIGLGVGPSAEVLGQLPYRVPDLSVRQQSRTRLPGDFAAAFDEYFAEAAREERAAAGLGADAARLRGVMSDAVGVRLLDADAGPEAAGWRLSGVAPDGSAAVTFWGVAGRDFPEAPADGRSSIIENPPGRPGRFAELAFGAIRPLPGRSRDMVTAYRDETRLRGLAARVDLHGRIRAGLESPWAFLPATDRQRHATAGCEAAAREDPSPAREALAETARRSEGFPAGGWGPRSDHRGVWLFEDPVAGGWSPLAVAPPGPG